MEREEKIDEILNHAGQAGFGMVKRASTVVMNHASSGIVSAAMKISKASTVSGWQSWIMAVSNHCWIGLPKLYVPACTVIL